MSQNYEFKSLEIAKNGQEKERTQKDPNTVTVFETGDTHTIDFILLDGTRQCFLYSHMLTAWIGKDDNAENDVTENERYIKIFFATHLVTIKGFCLDEIYNALTTLSLKSTKTHDERYLSAVSDDNAFVTNIKITWKKEDGEIINNRV
ncbi:hypothetical protein Q4Q35_06290 [Flavivirga aquimarina]|uniref:Uncharacterized protein n=1 Tax=Flavivirga aquimarina TaxID=2027862 RepID=A0ABT8W8E8_9FLAO|nr:hypothetical protein [Flavivirga aquimarina]MDO5969410.1 hypothetical protein [Flavivirga aquimarina]